MLSNSNKIYSKIHLEDDTDCSTEYSFPCSSKESSPLTKNPIDWDEMLQNLTVNDEKSFKAKVPESKNSFSNLVIKNKKRKGSLWNEKSSLKEEKKRRASEGESCFVTWPQYKKLIQHKVVERSELGRYPKRNYQGYKYSVYEQREKKNGVDVLIDEQE